MIRAAKKRAKEEGKTLDEILLDIAYAQVGGIEAKVDVRERLAAIKLFKDFTMAKSTEQHLEVTDSRGPGIYLPEEKPDPAKVIPIDFKKRDEARKS